MNNKYLFLFSISPVQSFISQARKTKDLYAGSRLLSLFIKKQIKKLSDIEKGAEVIFPANISSDSLPNRFVAEIYAESDDKIMEIGNKLQKNFQRILEDEFEKLAKTLGIFSNKKIYLNQVLNTFESHWAAVKLEDDYRASYLQLEKIHAAAKNIKRFNQLEEQGRKCSLCGERKAYFYGNYNPPNYMDNNYSTSVKNNFFDFVKNEALCTICAIKRFFSKGFPSVVEIALHGTISKQDLKNLKYNDEKYNDELIYEENLTENFFDKNNIPKDRLEEIINIRNNVLKKYNLKSSELPKYYALIVFDGDKMGELLSGNKLKDNAKLEEFHKALSKALAENAKASEKVVNKYGKAVYAGGDDFLGFVSLKNLLSALKELSEIFKSCVNNKLQDYVKDKITMSAGIAIAHYKMPLKIVLDWARNMENTAKEKGKRNAFAISVLKHSGEIHKTVWKWNSGNESNIENMQKILEKLTTKKFSTNFIHMLEGEFARLDYQENDLYSKQFETELKRLIARSYMLNFDKDKEISELYNLCRDFYLQAEDKQAIKNYFELMRIIDFVARKLGGQQ